MADEKKTTEKYSVGEIATETGLSPIDNDTQKPVAQLELLVEIANKVDKMYRNVVPE